MSKLPELILFDLDGTLIDSAPDLAFAVNSCLQQMGRPPYPQAVIRNWIGNGIETLIHRALTGDEDGKADENQYDQAFTLFLQAYEENNGKYSQVYQGVIPALNQLQQFSIRMGVVTNKRGRFSEPLLADKQLLPYFDLIVSGDTLPQKKPHPAPLKYAAEYFSAKPELSIMVGDSKNDIEAGQAAGFKVFCVNYGYNRGIDLKQLKPDWLSDSFQALPDMIQTYDA